MIAVNQTGHSLVCLQLVDIKCLCEKIIKGSRSSTSVLGDPMKPGRREVSWKGGHSSIFLHFCVKFTACWEVASCDARKQVPPASHSLFSIVYPAFAFCISSNDSLVFIEPARPSNRSQEWKYQKNGVGKEKQKSKKEGHPAASLVFFLRLRIGNLFLFVLPLLLGEGEEQDQTSGLSILLPLLLLKLF